MPALALLLLPAPLPVGAAFEEVAVFRAPEAHQAVAADADHFYAIGNRVVAKYDKRTGEKVASFRSSDRLPLIHLNGGQIVGGRLVLSHSNFPLNPPTGSIETFDPETLRPVPGLSRSLGTTDGSLTAAVTDSGGPTVFLVLAHYELPDIPGYDTGSARTEVLMIAGEEPATAPLLREGYTLPAVVVDRLRPHSVSGASLWPPGPSRLPRDQYLFLTGHDRPEVYQLVLPAVGSELKLVAVHPAPIAGQGIAWDPAERGVLWGTRRREGLVVKMRLP